MDIHITRKGEKHGPYPEATARQFLEEGKLLPTDLAWHAGADGWKPLSEVLGAAAQPPATPPSPPGGGIPKRTMAGAAPAEEKPEDSEPDDPDKISVTRKGEPIGPYSREKAKEYFASGQLLPTDWGWHDGMDDWKPINEVLGVEVPAQPAITSAVPAQTVSAAPVKARARGGRTGKIVALVFLYIIGFVVVLPLIAVGLTIGSLQVGANTQAIIGGVLKYLGYLATVYAWIWILLVAYQENPKWCVLCFCFCPAQLIFLIMYWREAHRPFLLYYIGSWVGGTGIAMIDVAANR
jgi:hypothetical protein